MKSVSRTTLASSTRVHAAQARHRTDGIALSSRSAANAINAIPHTAEGRDSMLRARANATCLAKSDTPHQARSRRPSHGSTVARRGANRTMSNASTTVISGNVSSTYWSTQSGPLGGGRSGDVLELSLGLLRPKNLFNQPRNPWCDICQLPDANLSQSREIVFACDSTNPDIRRQALTFRAASLLSGLHDGMTSIGGRSVFAIQIGEAS